MHQQTRITPPVDASFQTLLDDWRLNTYCTLLFYPRPFQIWESPPAFLMERYRSNGGEHVNTAYDSTLDEPPLYEESNRSNGDHRMVRPSVISAFGHDTLDRLPHVDFYRNAGSVSGHRAVRPSLQELHDVFQKVSACMSVNDVKLIHLCFILESLSSLQHTLRTPFSLPLLVFALHLTFCRKYFAPVFLPVSKNSSHWLCNCSLCSAPERHGPFTQVKDSKQGEMKCLIIRASLSVSTVQSLNLCFVHLNKTPKVISGTTHLTHLRDFSAFYWAVILLCVAKEMRL